MVLVRLRPQTHVMLVILHHIVCDGRSLDLLAYELATSYAAFCGGIKPTLEPPPLQYADYARWQAEWLSSTEFRVQLSRWTEKLAGAPLVLDLSVDAARPTAESFDGSTQTRMLPKHLVQQLQDIARRYNVTPFTLLLTVFQILLYHYSGERDFLIGIPVAARRSVELEKVVGLFANLVVVRADLSGSANFSRTAARSSKSGPWRPDVPGCAVRTVGGISTSLHAVLRTTRSFRSCLRL